MIGDRRLDRPTIIPASVLDENAAQAVFTFLSTSSAIAPSLSACEMTSHGTAILSCDVHRFDARLRSALLLCELISRACPVGIISPDFASPAFFHQPLKLAVDAGP
jgi:succinate dehydrogenase/fumarate reductase-like Fe-S protein